MGESMSPVLVGVPKEVGPHRRGAGDGAFFVGGEQRRGEDRIRQVQAVDDGRAQQCGNLANVHGRTRSVERLVGVRSCSQATTKVAEFGVQCLQAGQSVLDRVEDPAHLHLMFRRVGGWVAEQEQVPAVQLVGDVEAVVDDALLETLVAVEPGFGQPGGSPERGPVPLHQADDHGAVPHRLEQRLCQGGAVAARAPELHYPRDPDDVIEPRGHVVRSGFEVLVQEHAPGRGQGVFVAHHVRVVDRLLHEAQCLPVQALSSGDRGVVIIEPPQSGIRECQQCLPKKFGRETNTQSVVQPERVAAISGIW